MREKSDPISLASHALIEQGLITEDEVKAIEKTARAEMKVAVEQGLASPYPPIEELYNHVLDKEVSHDSQGDDDGAMADPTCRRCRCAAQTTGRATPSRQPPHQFLHQQ